MQENKDKSLKAASIEKAQSKIFCPSYDMINS